MLVINKIPETILKALTAKAGAAIWRSLSPETKWQLIKVNTAILSKAATRSITRNPSKLALITLTVALIGGFLLWRKEIS